MKKNKVSNLNLIAALFCYIAAIMSYSNKNSSMGAVYLCLGSSNLCIGAVNKKKEDLEENDNEKKDK